MKLYMCANNVDDDFLLFFKKPVPCAVPTYDERGWGKAYYKRASVMDPQPELVSSKCSNGKHLADLVAPLTFEGKQLVELEVELKEVARWEHPEPNDRRPASRDEV